MKGQELFGVVVRSAGLYLVISGAWYLIYGFLHSAGTLVETQLGEDKLYFASGIPFLLGGCLMLRGADWFVRFSYPPADASSDDQPRAIES